MRVMVISIYTAIPSESMKDSTAKLVLPLLDRDLLKEWFKSGCCSFELVEKELLRFFEWEMGLGLLLIQQTWTIWYLNSWYTGSHFSLKYVVSSSSLSSLNLSNIHNSQLKHQILKSKSCMLHVSCEQHMTIWGLIPNL